MKSLLAASLLGLSSIAYGQATINKGGINYAVSVPANTASSKSGDIFIQISGPTSNSWIGIGQGSAMAGSNMFIIYASSSGKNVTLSQRTASGHNMPTAKSSQTATLMAGSGIVGSVMTANIRCTDCSANVDVTSSSTNWIYGAKSGAALNTDSVSASIAQHSGYGVMSLNLAQAKASSNNSPFTSSAAGGNCQQAVSSGTSSNNNGASQTTSTGASGFFGGYRPPWATSTANNKRSPQATTPAAAAAACTSSSGGSSLEGLNSYDAQKQNQILMAHGILAGIAFAILFPFGAISIRLLSFPGLVVFHAAFQAFAYLTYIAAFGLGVYMATQMRYLQAAHPVIGIVVFILLFFQPILGYIHHRNFKKFQTRTITSHGHIWLGRILITLGIINGGLGFQLAGNTAWGAILYGVIAGIMFLAYVVAIVIGERRRKRNALANPPKYDEAVGLEESPRRRNSHRGSDRRSSGTHGRHETREFYGRQK